MRSKRQTLEATRTAIEENGRDALARSAHRELRAEIQARLDLAGTPLDVIRALIAAHVRWADSHPDLYRLLVSHGYQRRSQQRTVERSYLAAEITAVAARYFPQLADDPDAVETTLIGLIGLVDASVLRWLIQPVVSREQLIDRLTAEAWVILDQHLRKHGICVDPAVSLMRSPTGR